MVVAGNPLRKLLLAAIAVGGCESETLDEQLRGAMAGAGVEPLDYVTSPHVRRVALGRALFYDKVLSGNRDIACSSCHHPTSATSDGLSLAVGTGGTGVGPERVPGEGRGYLPRHTPELFSRGVEDWQALGWDGQVQRDEPWPLPSGVSMPRAIGDDLLAAHVMLKVADRASMRGIPGDFDVDGEENTLAYWADDELRELWDELIERLVAIPGYVELFAAAYPEVAVDDLGFEHAALALAAYTVDAFALSESPWDRYVMGDDTALTRPAKRGARLFYGKAQCGECHGGSLLTDQGFHNVCAPQLGTQADPGRANDYAFRTPPLRNVALTAPYMHAGSHATLEDAVRDHLDPCAALGSFTGGGLPPRFAALVIDDDATLAAIEATADPLAQEPIDLDDEELADLVQFLEALSDPKVESLGDIRPDSVPSGLPVDP
jgi:cytochrome c peroxidase